MTSNVSFQFNFREDFGLFGTLAPVIVMSLGKERHEKSGLSQHKVTYTVFILDAVMLLINANLHATMSYMSIVILTST